jgi:hypothetical protein
MMTRRLSGTFITVAFELLLARRAELLLLNQSLGLSNAIMVDELSEVELCLYEIEIGYVSLPASQDQLAL